MTVTVADDALCHAAEQMTMGTTYLVEQNRRVHKLLYAMPHCYTRA